MNKSLLLLLPLLLISACEPNVDRHADPQNSSEESSLVVDSVVDSPEGNQEDLEVSKVLDQNDDFDQFKEDFLEAYWSLYPDYAVYVGYYKFDNLLPAPNGELRAQRRSFLANELQALNQFDASQLSVSNATDWQILRNELQSQLWYIDRFREYEWNPAQYNVAGPMGLILGTEYKPLSDRLLTIFQRLKQVPDYYQAAIKGLKNPTAEHTTLAIQQTRGAMKVFSEQIPAKLPKGEWPNQPAWPTKDEFQARLDLAQEALQGYLDWLEEQQVGFADTPAKGFRIGEELYEQKFNYDIASSYTAKELYERALIAKEELHAEMTQLTETLWPKYMADKPIPEDRLVAIKAMIDLLSARHIQRDEFVDEIKRQIPVIQQFMDDKGLVESDPTRPLVVRLTPEYQRGFAGASINAPGPYDSTANTYYNVSPLDDFTDEQAESYLREYNHWILQILNIHEAIPGHYTQLMHANKSPSKIKSIFANGAMIEGWAVYSERMMLENGYGDNEPEMWLMYGKWNLRVVINTILDYSIQVLGMEKEAALDLMINEGFQEQTEAQGKWRRATISQVQLTSYFNGFSEIYGFREDLKKAMGESFSLRQFHDLFLSYGNAPVAVIKRLMTNKLCQEVEQPSEAFVDYCSSV